MSFRGLGNSTFIPLLQSHLSPVLIVIKSYTAFLSLVLNLMNENIYLLVVKTTVLLADINDFGTVNEIYKMCE